MSDISTKLASLEFIAQSYHSGSETLSDRESAVKNIEAGKISSVDAPATTYEFTHSDSDEMLVITGLTAATALNITAGSNIQVGATLTVRVEQGATGYDLTTDAEGAGIVGVADDIDTAVFKYFGTEFGYVQVSVFKNVDAA